VTGPIKVAIIGSGPAGLSAGARAAAKGVSHVVLEREPRFAETIQRYQRGKFVMATPDILPLRSDLEFAANTRETILGIWDRQLGEQHIEIRYGSPVRAIKGRRGAFTIELEQGGTIEAENVVLAIGVQGNIRKLAVPGADQPWVQYQLDDPDAYEEENIVVVGAGDAAIENAIALTAKNKVTIVNRGNEFAKAKLGNQTAIEKAEAAKAITVARNAQPVRIEGNKIVLKVPEGEREVPVDRIIARLGAIPPKDFLASCGVMFPKEDSTGFPELSTTYETNVPGLYAIGALAGYPLIKHCMNQGFEVIETIAGTPVKPADEPLLEERLQGLPGRPSVEEALAAIKSGVPLLSALTTLQLREFLLDSETRVALAGETILTHDAKGDSLFLILSGAVRIEVVDRRGRDRTVVRGAGEFFGELGLVAGRRRAETVRAMADTVLIELSRRSAVKLLASVASARAYFDKITIVRQLQDDVLPELTEEDLAGVIEKATIERLPAGKVLIQEGAQDRFVFMIRSGSAVVSQKGPGGASSIVNYVPSGELVGEIALLRDVPRTATITTAIETEVVRLDGEEFSRLLDLRPDLREKIEEAAQKRQLEGVRSGQDGVKGRLTDFFVEEGLGEATNALLIDDSLCIRCDNCETACAESHGGIARMDRDAGSTFAMIHIPTACRHCEHPHCMTECPPDAIHRSEANGEVWIDDTCIGCGACQQNCPYGVIRLSYAAPKKSSLLMWLLFGRGSGPGEVKAHVEHGHSARKVATKCDLCKDIKGGPACVRACPTGAAIRVRPHNYLQHFGERSG
jgi:thioredoxin reductase/CRP-like cAMP-binding protein/Fe-S-cluster-containing hydrogenase component 2